MPLRRRLGFASCQIRAIACDTTAFETSGLSVINPWCGKASA
jgi:hypothetical protein